MGFCGGGRLNHPGGYDCLDSDHGCPPRRSRSQLLLIEPGTVLIGRALREGDPRVVVVSVLNMTTLLLRELRGPPSWQPADGGMGPRWVDVGSHWTPASPQGPLRSLPMPQIPRTHQVPTFSLFSQVSGTSSCLFPSHFADSLKLT